MKVGIALAAAVAIDQLDDWWRENRPKSRLAIEINALAGDSVPLSYFTTVDRKKD